MISQFSVSNFKSFSNKPLPLRSLTVFCGRNSVGKTTVAQAMLLARCVATAGDPKLPVSLNGAYGLELGTVGDILSYNLEESPNPEIVIALVSEQGASTIRFPASQEHLTERFLIPTVDGAPLPSALRTVDYGAFAYLSAERLGPRDIQAVQSLPSRRLSVGSKGEFVAEMLVAFERRRIRAELLHPEHRDVELLLQQVQFWMSEWIPSFQVKPVSLEGTNAAAVRFQRHSLTSEWMRPGNTGFGVSYSLPIVVAGLLMEPGSLFIVDTPEAHLHPAGQSAIGKFLAVLAAAGVQVLVETHSEHVINGIRIAIADPEHPLTSEKVLVHNFDLVDGVTAVESIEVTERGSLTAWPPHFLDQIERELAALARLSVKHGKR